MIRSQHKLNIETVLYIILLFAIGFWFLLLNWNTPFMHDDLAYHYYYDSNSALERPTSEPITSFWQIFPSMWNHYNAVNGRFTSHLIIQLFCGLLGKSVFNYINTCIFILFCDLIVLLSCGKRKLLPLAIVVVSVMYLLPFPGQTMLWLTGSVNYLWSATFSLIVIKFLIVGGKRSIITTLMLFLFAIFAGWMNESISFGIGGGLVVYFFMHKDRFMGVSRWIVLGYLLGCLMILLSPGTMNRAASGEINTELDFFQMISSRIMSTVFLMKTIPILLITWIVILFSCFKCGKVSFEDRRVIVYSFIVSAFFCFLLGIMEPRVYFGMAVLGVIIAITTFYSSNRLFNFPHTVNYCVSVLIFALCVSPAIKALDRTSEYSQYSKDVESRIKSSPSECVIEAIPFYSSRFVYATRVYANRYQLHNRVRSFYYHKKFVCAIPKQLYTSYKTHNLSLAPDNYLIISLESSHKEIKGITAQLSPDINLSNRQRVIRYLLGTLNDRIIIPDYAILDYQSESLLFVPRQDNINKLLVTFKNGLITEFSCE